MSVYIDAEWVERICNDLPEPAHEKFERMTTKLCLPEHDSKIISSSQTLSYIFDGVIKLHNKPKDVSNWIIGELLAVSKDAGVSDDDVGVDIQKFACIIKMVDDGKINRSVGKKVLIEVFEKNTDPEIYVLENSLSMVSDTGLLETTINEILEENEKSVTEYLNGSQKVFGFLVGQVMKKTSGKADPRTVNDLLKNILDSK